MYTLNPSNPSFFNSEKLYSEFVRQVTVCHGCRMCVNYCDSFPVLFKKIDSKEQDLNKLTLDDLFDVASKCFHCKLCYVNCPYIPPHEFNMDFPSLMEWAWLYYKSKTGLRIKDYMFEMLDATNLARPLVKHLMQKGKEVLGLHKDAPTLPVSEKGLKEKVKPKKIENPKAKVALFTTCLVDNFFTDIGEDLIEVYNSLGIEVIIPNFLCCGAPMLDAGDVNRLKKNAEHNMKLIEELINKGYDIVVPIPTCALMIKEYHRVLDKKVPKVYDSIEYLQKLKNEGKIELNAKFDKTIYYHPPCHLKYLQVGLPGPRLLRTLGAKVEISNKGCSGIDGGWGLRNYNTARRVGSKMMESFKQSKADVFMTECPLAGLQIEKASNKRPLHPIQLLKEAMKNG
ncbi:glycerol-3-phosphate dehydrogenase [Sulfolobus acidocaldarius SUSAZ]|nr:glycerol-3-phosphate dehydrogenase [Sulfolobus acidocaldarius SUSAZ]